MLHNNELTSPHPSPNLPGDSANTEVARQKASQYLPAISGTLTTLIGSSAVTLPHSLPRAFQSKQAENRSADKRCADGEVLMAESFLPLRRDRSAARGGEGREGGGSVSAELSKQQGPLCKTLRMHAQFSISCTSGEAFLISDCLYLQMGRWPFVCR